MPDGRSFTIAAGPSEIAFVARLPNVALNLGYMRPHLKSALTQKLKHRQPCSIAMLTKPLGQGDPVALAERRHAIEKMSPDAQA